MRERKLYNITNNSSKSLDPHSPVPHRDLSKSLSSAPSLTHTQFTLTHPHSLIPNAVVRHGSRGGTELLPPHLVRQHGASNHPTHARHSRFSLYPSKPQERGVRQPIFPTENPRASRPPPMRGGGGGRGGVRVADVTVRRPIRTTIYNNTTYRTYHVPPRPRITDPTRAAAAFANGRGHISWPGPFAVQGKGKITQSCYSIFMGQSACVCASNHTPGPAGGPRISLSLSLTLSAPATEEPDIYGHASTGILSFPST